LRLLVVITAKYTKPLGKSNRKNDLMICDPYSRFADVGIDQIETRHNQAVLFRHYRELVRPNAAKKHFSIRPAGNKKVIDKR